MMTTGSTPDMRDFFHGASFLASRTARKFDTVLIGAVVAVNSVRKDDRPAV